MNNIFERTIGLIGEKAFQNLQTKTICVVGLGGVGGTAFEALVRTGFSSFVIVDKDIVCESNLNRQILYTAQDINKSKVECAKEKILSINPEAQIKYLKTTISKDSVNCLDNFHIDLIVDCIDSLEGKVALIKYAKNKDIPIVCSLGMGNKLDPSKIQVIPLNKTTADPLARKLRYMIKEEYGEVINVPCVCSLEQPVSSGTSINSLITVTSTAGLYLASYVFSYFINK